MAEGMGFEPMILISKTSALDLTRRSPNNIETHYLVLTFGVGLSPASVLMCFNMAPGEPGAIKKLLIFKEQLF